MKNVGIIITDLYDMNQQTFLNGCRGMAKRKGIRLFIFHADRLFHMPMLRSKRLDGIIMLTAPIRSKYGQDMVEQFVLSLKGLPVISIGVKLQGVKTVYINGAQGVEALMDHLINEHGARNIAFVKGPDSHSEAQIRFEAYKSSLERHGIPCNYKLITPGSFSHGDGRKAISLLMDIRKVTFDTVFCCHDQAALDVINSLRNRGVVVPDDVRVVGYDNLDISGSFTPSLTTVRQPLFNVGQLAVEKLVQFISGNEVDDNTKVDTQVILRESCGCQRHMGSYITETNSSKENVEEVIYGLRDDIIKRYIINCGVGEIEEAVNSISDSIIKSAHSGDLYNLAKDMEKLIGPTYTMDLDSAFWRFLLEEFFIGIHRAGYSSLFTNALLILYENEKRTKDQIRVEDSILVQQINSIGDRLLTCSTEDQLKEVLKGQLSSLKVGNCFVIRYLDHKKKSELFFCRDTHDLFEDNYQVFDVDNILPNLKRTLGEESYIINPLKDSDRDVGYVVFELNSHPYILYSFLSDKISYGLNNVKVIDRLNSYNQELEKAVEERTEELSRINRLLKERSIKDTLTGLYNRRFLEDVVYPKSDTLIKERLEGAELKSATYGVILVDLDHFKQVNDIYGHVSGDLVIKELGKIFSYLVRPEDYVIRLGGEEFLIILRQFNSDYLFSVVEKVREGVKSHPFVMENGDSIQKTCSIGAMIFPHISRPELITFRDVIAIIDKALYKSKDYGRDKGHIIEIDSSAFDNITNPGEYIINNFDNCLGADKIKLFDSNS